MRSSPVRFVRIDEISPSTLVVDGSMGFAQGFNIYTPIKVMSIKEFRDTYR